MTVAHILLNYREALFSGLLVTLSLAGIAWSCGIILGCLLGGYAHARSEAGNAVAVIGFFLSSIPFLIILFWLHYPLQEILMVVVAPFFTAACALSMVNTVLVAQIVRNVLDEFPNEYAVAGRVCGLTERDIFLHIKLPIVLRALLPQILLTQVQILQMTLFASLISVDELFRVAQRINSVIYRPIEIYTSLALFFIGICLPLNLLAHRLKARYTRDMSDR